MSKQLLIASISSALATAVSDPSFKPCVSDVEPYEGEGGLFSITGYVGIRAPIEPVAGFEVTHIDMNFECIFHNCTADHNTATYEGDPSDYELRFSEMDNNLFWANHADPKNADWQYQSDLNLSYYETCEISKAVLTKLFAEMSAEQKKSMLTYIYNVLKTQSTMQET